MDEQIAALAPQPTARTAPELTIVVPTFNERDNIRVNTISPFALTRMTESMITGERAAMYAPELVSPAVMYLVSEDAPTGMILSAGAGTVSRAPRRISHWPTNCSHSAAALRSNPANTASSPSLSIRR